MKRLTRLFIMMLTILLCGISAHAAGTTVTNLKVDGTVDRYGDFDAVITADITFSESQQQVELPLGANIKGVSLDGGDMSLDRRDGNTYLIVKNSSGTIGPATYTVRYTKTKNVTVASDKTQALQVELLSALWEWGIDSLQFTVTMPKTFEAVPAFRSGYYGEDVVITSAVEEQVISGTTTKALLDRESLTLNLTLPAGFFRLRHVVGGSNVVVLILVGLLTVLGTAYWFQALRNPKPKAHPRRLSPDGVSAWEFPYVIGCGTPDPVLLVSEWAALGYLTIYLGRRNRVSLCARMPMSNERRAAELKAFAALFRRDDVCFGDTPRFRQIGDKAANTAKRFWDRRLFLKTSGAPLLLHFIASVILGLIWMRAVDYLVPSWSLRSLILFPALVLGILGGMATQRTMQDMARRGQNSKLAACLTLLTTILLGKFGGWLFSLFGLLVLALSAFGTFRGGKRTAFGLELAGQISAFRRYLKSSDTHHLQLMLHQDSQYFYDVLPYAEALGLGRHFAKRFANIQMEPCAWLDGDRIHYKTALEFYEIYHTVLNKMRGKGK